MSIGLSADTFNDVDIKYNHLIKNGATVISAPDIKPWGHREAYLTDPEGNILALIAVSEQIV